MFDGPLALIAIVAASASILQLGRLSRLGQECRDYARAKSGNANDTLLAMIGDQDLDKHQKILRTEMLAACLGLLVSFSCLMGVVIVSSSG